MNNKLSFEEITKDILENEKFLKIKGEAHHGITRMDHSMRVARKVYNYSIKHKKIDYVSATRAALLHDFFTNEEFLSNKGLIQGVVHPDIALSNSKGEFEINEIEANAIEAHMFPLSTVIPKYKESWILTLADKIVAIYEMCLYKFNYHKLTEPIGNACVFTFLFMFYQLTLGRD